LALIAIVDIPCHPLDIHFPPAVFEFPVLSWNALPSLKSILSQWRGSHVVHRHCTTFVHHQDPVAILGYSPLGNYDIVPVARLSSPPLANPSLNREWTLTLRFLYFDLFHPPSWGVPGWGCHGDSFCEYPS